MIGLRASFLGLAIGFATLGACGASPSSDATSDTPTTSQEVTRPTIEEMRADYVEALAKAQATQGPGSPAMWKMADEDTTVYIFGTVHLLRPELEWRYPAFDAALAEADTVVFEVDMESPEAQRELMTEFMGRGMFDDGRTLREVLNEADEAAIEKGMQTANVPLDAFNAFEPWMAAINLTAMKMVSDGFDPEAGVEKVIQREAEADGKRFAYLETIKDQADAFDLLPEEAQIEMLYGTALGLGDSAEMLDHMVDEWADGDVQGLGVLAGESDGAGFSDALYEAVLVKRNRNWVPVIEAMLDEPGTVMIAAGSAHFAGPDSVILMLEEEGYTVERVN